MSQRTRMNPAERTAQILATAKQAFASDSYANVSVAQVAKDAGVSVALVHKYFESKTGLFAAVLEENFRILRQRQNDYLEGKTIKRDRVGALIESYLDFIADLKRPYEVGHLLYGHDDARSNEVRRLDERTFAVKLRTIVQPNESSRDFFAIQSFQGLLQSATRAWVQRGCQPDEKYPVIEAVLGGLEGALGDWDRR
ncbi:transcriptional regulator BetI [Corynebacterium kalinowskii]|uniref:Transcriptional regulator BetI n=1 Tax=Corynebacterium kalinowskii TaxID=2675216 RepID=A0A6B8VW80_9CORY|nr:TetR/AcrR family transcriptional regulator [Corynebacterium kalinowskii]QGU03185.1 transcriptional regulator BetI [Corynebacterium kalinowskii]